MNHKGVIIFKSDTKILYISPAHKKIAYNCLVFLSIVNEYLFTSKFLFYLHAKLVIWLSMFLLVFIVAFMSEDSVSYSYTHRLIMQSTPFLNWFFCYAIYLDPVRDHIFKSVWDYLTASDNLRVFSTALKSDNQPLTTQNLPSYPKPRQGLIQTNNASIWAPGMFSQQAIVTH